MTEPLFAAYSQSSLPKTKISTGRREQRSQKDPKTKGPTRYRAGKVPTNAFEHSDDDDFEERYNKATSNDVKTYIDRKRDRKKDRGYREPKYEMPTGKVVPRNRRNIQLPKIVGERDEGDRRSGDRDYNNYHRREEGRRSRDRDLRRSRRSPSSSPEYDKREVQQTRRRGRVVATPTVIEDRFSRLANYNQNPDTNPKLPISNRSVSSNARRRAASSSSDDEQTNKNKNNKDLLTDVINKEKIEREEQSGDLNEKQMAARRARLLAGRQAKKEYSEARHAYFRKNRPEKAMLDKDYYDSDQENDEVLEIESESEEENEKK